MRQPNSQLRTAETIHGLIEYETVVCDSCRQTMNREAADRFFIGTIQERNEYRSLGHTTIEFDYDTLAEGWICSYCRDSDDGPAGYPPERQPTLYEQFMTADFIHLVGFAFVLWFAILLTIVVVL